MRVVVEARAAFATRSPDPALLDAPEAALPVVDGAQRPLARAVGAIVQPDEHDEGHDRHGDDDAGRAMRRRRPDRGDDEREGRDARIRQLRRAPLDGGDLGASRVTPSAVFGSRIAVAHAYCIPCVLQCSRMQPLRIANCSGFWGDRPSGAAEMVRGGPIDVLTGDYLAELTMAILAKQRAAGRGGFVGTFLTQMEEVLAECMAKRIKIVSNAGGLDPRGLGDALAALAAEARRLASASPSSRATI